MEIKDVLTLCFSLIALTVSVLNFYLSRIRKRESLFGSLISVGINEGDWDTKAEYSLCNAGDVQLLLKEVGLFGSGGGQGLPNNTTNNPVVIKPGDIVQIDVYFNSGVVNNDDHVIVEFGVFSASGKGYRLPHDFRVNGHEPKNKWEVFKLKRVHEGF